MVFPGASAPDLRITTFQLFTNACSRYITKFPPDSVCTSAESQESKPGWGESHVGWGVGSLEGSGS